MNDNIEQMLRERPVEPPRSGFEQRILAIAYARAQTVSPSLLGWLRKTWEELMLPTPQLTFALTLAIGLAIGFGASSPDGHSASAIEMYLSDDGAIL